MTAALVIGIFNLIVRPALVVLTLPAKDPRAYLLAGGTGPLIAGMVRDLQWNQPTERKA